MQTSWTTPPLAQAFQLLSIHRGQILKLQQDSHLPLALTLPQQTTTAPLNSLSVSPEKPTPRFCPNFPRAGRVKECEVHTSASFLARKQDCPFSGGSSPHTPRQKGENAGKLKFRPQSNVSRSGQRQCAAFHFVCLSQAGGKGGC